MSVESCVTIRSQILQRLTTTSGHGIEDAALSLLALRNSGADPHALLGTQHRSGAWSALPNIEPPSAFHTALALLAIRPFQTTSVRRCGRARIRMAIGTARPRVSLALAVEVPSV